MQPSLVKLAHTNAPAPVILIRFLLSAIFLSEGIQKFFFPALVGAGRFEKIGIPFPQVMAPFVGIVEIVGGSLLLLGLLTRLASIILLISMCVAITSTKLPILVGHQIWRFSLPKLPQYGFWSAMHEARTDLLMIGCLLFLLIVGPGPWSLDTRIFGSRQDRTHPS
jgi:uncharacterized membrane protein YphA (DoxX/SURF4 family)